MCYQNRLVFILLVIFLMAGCYPTELKDKTPIKVINEKQDLLEEPKISSSIEKELKRITTQYIKAEYDGDINTLLTITREDALNTVKSGELQIFQSHKLDKIVSFNIARTKLLNTYLMIATVSSYEPNAAVPTIYYEHLWFKDFNNKWFIIKIERDA